LSAYETLAHTIHMIKKGWKQSTLPGVMINLKHADFLGSTSYTLYGLVLDFVTKVPYCKHLCLTSLYEKLSIKNLLVFQISLCAGEQGH